MSNLKTASVAELRAEILHGGYYALCELVERAEARAVAEEALSIAVQIINAHTPSFAIRRALYLAQGEAITQEGTHRCLRALAEHALEVDGDG